MSDLTTVNMLLDFIVGIAVGLYGIAFSYWFISLPLFTMFLVWFLRVIIFGIGPSNANRKH